MNNKQKGDLYEVQIRNFIISNLNNKAFLWNDTPENLLIQHNIIGSHNEHRINRILNKNNPIADTGIDVIQIDDDNNCILIQCKNGYNNGITMNDLAGFMCWMAHLNNNIGYVYYTNKLSHNIKSLPNTNRINYIKQKFIIEDDDDIIIEIIEPYDYQLEAKEKFDIHFRNENRGILSMPCGTGKTFTSYLISNNYKQIIIVSPLKQFAKQNLERYKEYGFSGNTLLVDSDGERDIDNIKNFIENNDTFVISATFFSIDVIYECLEYFDDPLFIVDEFHNLSKTNIMNEENEFYKLLNSNYRILFMSATPRVYEMEDEDEDINIFGDMVYNMSFNEAIDKKYITDYRIWLPSISEDNTELNADIDTELSITDIDEVLKAKCIFLYSCLLNNGSKKCIVYCVDTKELIKMMELFELLNEFYCIEYESNRITSKTSTKNRTKRLNNFANNTKIQLLFSIRILDECIDIPSCDSIYITYPTQSKIRTIQRLCRCIRIDKNNPNKIGNIYIWCDEYSKILQTLSGIKEYDLFFKDKIKVNNVNQYNKSDTTIVKNDNDTVKNYSVDIIEFRQYTWDLMFNQLQIYLNTYNKYPNENIVLYNWMFAQIHNYTKKINAMKDNNKYNQWTNIITQYDYLFITRTDNWYIMFNKLELFLDTYSKRPTEINNKPLSKWISTQKKNYKDYNKKSIMKNDDIYKKWTYIITKHPYLCMTDIEKWYNMFEQFKLYLDTYQTRPTHTSDKQLRNWYMGQILNYNKKTHIMKNIDIYTTFTNLIIEYDYLFKTNIEKWYILFNKIEEFINLNKRRPLITDDKTYYYWVTTQIKNYRNNRKIMKSNEEVRNTWKTFTEKYPNLFNK
jgi:superfamily II DNA or RNA helicase